MLTLHLMRLLFNTQASSQNALRDFEMPPTETLIPYTAGVGALAIGAGRRAGRYWLHRGSIAGEWLLLKEEQKGDGPAVIAARYLVYLSPFGTHADRCTCPGSENRRSVLGSGCKHPGAIRQMLRGSK